MTDGGVIERVDPRSAEARVALTRYLIEASGRLDHPTFRATELVEVSATLPRRAGCSS
jgi:hypothetical protein